MLVGPPLPEAPRNEEEGEDFPVSMTTLSCYTARGYENPVWQLPDGNGSEAFIVSSVSVYETQLIINPSLFPDDYIDKVVCITSNGFVNSSVIVTTRKC